MAVYTDASSGAGGAFNPGGIGRIPLGDAGGTALTTSAAFRYITATRRISDASFAYVYINDALGTGMGYSSCSIDLDTVGIILSAPQRVRVINRFCEQKGADVATATTLTFTDGNVFVLTGTTTCNHITTTQWLAGSTIKLKFSGNVTVTNNAGSPPGGTAPMQLVGGANVSATANDWIQLTYDGTNWCQSAPTAVN